VRHFHENELLVAAKRIVRHFLQTLLGSNPQSRYHKKRIFVKGWKRNGEAKFQTEDRAAQKIRAPIRSCSIARYQRKSPQFNYPWPRGTKHGGAKSAHERVRQRSNCRNSRNGPITDIAPQTVSSTLSSPSLLIDHSEQCSAENTLCVCNEQTRRAVRKNRMHSYAFGSL